MLLVAGMFLIALIVFDPETADRAYTIGGVSYAVLIATNCLIMMWAQNRWGYFGWSLLASLCFILISGLAIEFAVEVNNLTGSGESGMIFLIVIYHPLLLLTMIFGKWVILKLKT